MREALLIDELKQKRDGFRESVCLRSWFMTG